MKEKKREIKFSQKELKIIEGLAKGLTDAEIAVELQLSKPTVSYYVDKLMRSTLTVNRPHLVYQSLKQGFIK